MSDDIDLFELENLLAEQNETPLEIVRRYIGFSRLMGRCNIDLFTTPQHAGKLTVEQKNMVSLANPKLDLLRNHNAPRPTGEGQDSDKPFDPMDHLFHTPPVVPDLELDPANPDHTKTRKSHENNKSLPSHGMQFPKFLVAPPRLTQKMPRIPVPHAISLAPNRNATWQ